MSFKHFGVRVLEGKYGLNLTREKYAIINKKNSLCYFKGMKENYEDKDGEFYKDEWCETYRNLCLENFDLNISFFKRLDSSKFNNEINSAVDKYNLKKVEDLNLYDNCGGYYLMVLDKYTQVYIGYTTNIKQRIQRHWSSNKHFDRLLFPMYNVENSRLSIDSFRAFDTTKIYAIKRRHSVKFEDSLIKEFSDEFVLNRINGGFSTTILDIEVKSRNLINKKTVT